MSDDIVKKVEWLLKEGAQIIKDQSDEIERWQDIARRLYLFIQDPCTHNHWCDVCSSIDAYEKAVNNG